ncbi:hypothetical protein C2G38_1174579 [Gigaspora rosea]|uniref:MD-2-related lipid-recognition domain-containing protein n=1 Tax=Gigaspora rosea TaxID=44941 RepID=A0A397VDW2_9GLOM|nr:hypothetical protein C2G38_1174579 [Gigaspora rosea]
MKNFIFASILFALLLTVNAAPFQKLNKRALNFGPCYPDVDSLDINVRPDPPESEKLASFYVSGNLTKNDIIDGITILLIQYADFLGNPIPDASYYRHFTDSFKAGTPFYISESDLLIPELPDSYQLLVKVGDDADNSVLFACAFVIVGGRSEISKVFDFL